MRKSLLFASMVALLASACSKPDRYETMISAMSKDNRAEARLRLQECDEMAETIAPSTDRSGDVEAFGISFGLRAAEFKNTASKDQYLLALLNAIQTCREWAVFNATEDEFDDAYLAMVDVSSRAYGAAEVDAKIQTLLDAYKGNSQLRPTNRVTQVSNVEEFRGLRTEQQDIIVRLARIEGLLGETTPAPGQGGGSTPGNNGALAHGSLPLRPVDPRETSKKIWDFPFATNSASLNRSALSEQRREIARFISECADWRGSVIGFADTRGGDQHNAALSIARANEVVRQLDIDDYRIVRSGGSGETEMFGQDYASNRLAKVTLWCAK